MSTQLNISFKSNETEQELYTFVKSQLSPGNYIKSLIQQAMLEEQGKITIAITNNTLNSQNKEDSQDKQNDDTSSEGDQVNPPQVEPPKEPEPEPKVEEVKVEIPEIDEQETEADLDDWSEQD